MWDRSEHTVVEQTSPPGALPVTVAEARRHLSLSPSETQHDAMLSDFIESSVDWLQRIYSIRFIGTVLKLYADAFPVDRIVTLAGPVSVVSSVKYFDTEDVLQTFTDYDEDLVSITARLIPKLGSAWPATRRKPNAIEIVHTAGYGAIGSDVPFAARAAILMLVAEKFEHRGETETGVSVAKVPMDVEALMASIPHTRAA